VQPSTFVPLSSEHGAFNIETDLGAIGAFRAHPHRGPLLYADLQRNADCHVKGILGSGRSGFYEGKYLKGVGRTTIAGNWAEHDVNHGSGHMYATYAIREYVATRWLAALGLEGSVNPCEGLLLSPLAPALRGFHERVFAGPHTRGHRVAALDRVAQGITVKPGGFARASNILWLLGHVQARNFAPALFGGLYRYCDPLSGGAEEATAADPDDVVDRLAGAMDRALASFRAFFRAGVYWGSFHNNFTLDGRFLDLEVPVLFGGPFFGLVYTRSSNIDVTAPTSGIVVGCEVFEYVRQLRMFLSALARELTGLVRGNHPFFGPNSRAFVRAFLTSLRARLKSHLVLRTDDLCATWADFIIDTLGCDGRDTATVRTIVRAQHRTMTRGSLTPSKPLRLRALPFPLAAVDSSRATVALAASFVPMTTMHERGAALNAELIAVDETRSVEEALAALKRLDAGLASPPLTASRRS
jgi:hypothetical protein